MKKKNIVGVIVASALIFGAIGVSAAGTSKTIKVVMGGTKFTLNGKDTAVPGAMTYNGKTYITVEEAAKLMDAQATDSKGKVDVKTGPNRSLKYPSGDDIDAVKAKMSPVIKKSDKEFLVEGESFVAFNAVNKGTDGYVISLGGNFVTLNFSAILPATYSSFAVWSTDADGKTIKKLAEYGSSYGSAKEQVRDISVDVTGLNYVKIGDYEDNVQFFNFTGTAK